MLGRNSQNKPNGFSSHVVLRSGAEITRCGHSTGKFPEISGILKGSPVFPLRILDEKTCSIYKFSQGITIYSYATILSFGDGSINEWNLCQMEHVLHSMDLSMESKFPEVFGKWPENALSLQSHY